MKFKDYTYIRPNFEQVIDEIRQINEQIKNSFDLFELKNAIDSLNNIKRSYTTMDTLSFIRNSINTQDSFYEQEVEVFQNEGPKVNSILNEVTKTLVSHPMRIELEKLYGSFWFSSMELSLKSFDDSIMDLMSEESSLITKYHKLMASAQIEFQGSICNLSQLRKYFSDLDRNVRKSAMEKINEFFEIHEEELDTIFDQLVSIRTQMAHKLGYKNYIELGYIRMGRCDYTAKDVEGYRKQILSDVVPVAEQIFKENLNRIGISDGKFYDLGLEFLDGNPIPIGDTSKLLQSAKQMYTEMSPETKEFFEYMMEQELLEVEAKSGKMGGGFSTCIADYKAPFIFSNFNGTKGDVEVLTHEAGHAFMAYSCRNNIENIDLLYPTSEACEIHSMSMEFFCYPWMNLFFGSSAEKYITSHQNGAITFIPYGACVDHYQHMVYENYSASPKQRKEMWRMLEKKYTPWRNMEGLKMYEKGTFWYNQAHIFANPFYYIDYTLAQVCALEFYLDSLDDPKTTWDRYLSLCRLGGSKSFLELISSVGIQNPFEDGAIHKTIKRFKQSINQTKI